MEQPIILSTTTKDDLVNEIVQKIVNEISKKNSHDYNLLNTEQVCKLFKVSEQTLINWEKSGKVKSKRVGRRKFFKQEDIENLLK